MKKYIYIYITLFLTIFGTSSCLDILDQDPLKSFSDAAVWEDLALAETYLNAQYVNLHAMTESDTRYSSFTEEVFQKHTYDSDVVTQGLLSCDKVRLGWDESFWDPWGNHYKWIKAVNLLLEKIDNVPGDEEWRNQIKGQGLFLRAWNYHILYGMFGRVPLIDHTYDLNSTFTETRADMDDVADFIVKDCDAAAKLLPLEYSKGKDFGRATRGAAMALKGRVLLYKASPLFGTPSVEKWKAASDANKAVIDLNKYSLKAVTNSQEYSDLFLDARNPEVIFLKLADPKYGTVDTKLLKHQAPCGPGNLFEGWGTYNPTQELVNKFQKADGTTPVIKKYYQDELPWADRELRFHATLLVDGEKWGYGIDNREVEIFVGEDGKDHGLDSPSGPTWWNASNTGYYMKKFLDYKHDAFGTTMMTTPWFFLRLSEIYLNYAECQIQLGNQSEALTYINKIRTRALLPKATGKDIWAEYYYERQIELLFESQRWFDMRRWKKMYEEYGKPVTGVKIVRYKKADGTYGKKYYTDNQISTRVFNDDKLYWIPVPRTELRRAPQLDAKPYE